MQCCSGAVESGTRCVLRAVLCHWCATCCVLCCCMQRVRGAHHVHVVRCAVHVPPWPRAVVCRAAAAVLWAVWGVGSGAVARWCGTVAMGGWYGVLWCGVHGVSVFEALASGLWVHVMGLTQTGLDRGTWCGTVLGVSKTTATRGYTMRNMMTLAVTGLVGAGFGIGAVIGERGE